MLDEGARILACREHTLPTVLRGSGRGSSPTYEASDEAGAGSAQLLRDIEDELGRLQGSASPETAQTIVELRQIVSEIREHLRGKD